MNNLTRNGFQQLDLDAQVILVGQLLLTASTAFLSLGQILKLLKVNELPTSPIASNRTDSPIRTSQGHMYSARGRSYFEN